MTIAKHKVFISYHHANDQGYKESLLKWNENNNFDIFIDASVDTGDINENLSDESIRQKIRDEYLRDSTVTRVSSRSFFRCFIKQQVWHKKRVQTR